MYDELTKSAPLWRIWGLATIYRVVLSYRRSYFGTLWIPVSLILIVIAKGVLFGGILNVQIERMMPNVALGLLLWRLYAGILVSSCSAFSVFKRDFESGYYPLFTPILNAIVKELFIFAHGLLPMIAITLYFITPTLSAFLYLIVGMMLAIFAILPIGFVLATISTRYRDIADLIKSTMRVIYFLTPVIWLPEMATGPYSWALTLNPFFHLIEIIRDPLAGQPIDPMNWVFVFVIGSVCWMMVAYIYHSYGRRILLWL